MVRLLIHYQLLGLVVNVERQYVIEKLVKETCTDDTKRLSLFLERMKNRVNFLIKAPGTYSSI